MGDEKLTDDEMCEGIIDAIDKTYNYLRELGKTSEVIQYHVQYKINNLTTDGRKYDHVIIDMFNPDKGLNVKLIKKGISIHNYVIKELNTGLNNDTLVI